MTEVFAFPQDYFACLDESDDGLFYRQPRMVVHIDAGAIRAATALFRAYLPPGGAILDLMSSWRSHLPPDVVYARVVGLGMNAAELRENPQLTERVVQNLNQQPRLPFGDAEFDACTLTVSVQYLVQPVAVFQDVGRVLKPNAPLIVLFSNRMFPSKAVAIWRALDDGGHIELVDAYLRAAGCFEQVEALDASPPDRRSDPLYAVIGRKRSGM